MPLTTLSAGNTVKSAELNANFALCVLTDTSRTITVTHTWSASQTFNAGFTGGSSADIAINTNKFTVTASTGATVIAGALTYGGVTLSNAVTGTGNMVLSASPTLTGTVTLTGASVVGLSALKTMAVGAATPSASGSGLSFPATQDASTDPNTLDDYEEGTWVPIDSSGAALSFSAAAGTYEKIGRLVIARCTLTYPATADGSSAKVGGLPFTVANAAETTQGFVGYTNLSTLSRLLVDTNATTTQLVDASGANITNATLSGKLVRFTASYHI